MHLIVCYRYVLLVATAKRYFLPFTQKTGCLQYQIAIGVRFCVILGVKSKYE